MRKRIISLLLLVAMALSLAAGVNATAYTPFTDVPANAWYAESVAYVRALGLMNGVSATRFAPQQAVTRAQMVTILHRMAGAPAAAPVQFTDTKQGKFYTEAVYWAAAEGVVTGYSDGSFRPNASISREQIVTMLWRYAGSPPSNRDLSGYIDAWNIGDYARTAMAWAVERGILSGYTDVTIRPKARAERAQIAKILHYYLMPDWVEYPANVYDKSKFYTDGKGWLHYRGAAGNDGYIGVDVSYYQGTIDWKKVKASGVDFAMIRAGYRGYGSAGTLVADTCFKQNMDGAKAAGVKVGVYFFSQATTVAEAVEEAEYVLNLIQGYKLDYPVAFDWETITPSLGPARTDNVTREQLTACTGAFCQVIAAAGYMPIVYSNPATVNSLLDLGYLTLYPFWLAHYTYNNPGASNTPTSFGKDFAMWQYTSYGVVPGINGRVDMDLCLVDWQ